jgi:hypothetical protein
VHGCSRVLALTTLPTLQDITEAIPMSDMRVATTFYELMELKWVSENTRLYHIVRKFIDLSGPMQEADLEYITQHFVRGEHRDGKGLAASELPHPSAPAAAASCWLSATSRAAACSHRSQPSALQL